MTHNPVNASLPPQTQIQSDGNNVWINVFVNLCGMLCKGNTVADEVPPPNQSIPLNAINGGGRSKNTSFKDTDSSSIIL